MICESCGDNSGKYNLCKKCYYLFKDGKLIKCEKCGKLIHLHCEDVVKLEQHLMDSHGFRMDPCRTVFYGLCEECRSAEDGEKGSETVHIRSK